MMKKLPLFKSVTAFAIVHLLGSLEMSTACTTMNDFFPEVFQHGNLSEVTWDHAVNSKRLLTEALANDKHMIEADVLLGMLINITNTGFGSPVAVTVIMGHPPVIISDLSLQNFLDTIVQHNKAEGTRKKGVKLDFKGSDAYARAMNEILLNAEGTALKPEYTTFPLWINGDIAKGPGNTVNNGVDLKLEEMKGKPEVMDAVTWSLGWTTGDYDENVKYTSEQIEQMKSVVNGIGNVTFPVRAMYAAKSREQMVDLLAVGTLTVWSGKQDDDHVDIDQLAKLIKDYLDKVYVDVPDSLWQRLNTAINRR